MRRRLRELVAEQGGRVDLIRHCPHGPDDGCDCRKPLSGLFRSIAEHYQVSLNGVPTVGDSLRDLQAGVAVGCRPYLVRTGKGAQTEQKALPEDRKSTRLNSSHVRISYAVFCLKKKKKQL